MLNRQRRKNAIIINNYKSGASNKKLQFFRLHLDREKNKSSLISVANPDATNTIIEDVLDAKKYWDSVTKVAKSDQKLKDLVSLFEYLPDTTHSNITKGLGLLKKKNIEAYEKQEELTKHLINQSTKFAICEAYCKLPKSSDMPEWITDLFSHLD